MARQRPRKAFPTDKKRKEKSPDYSNEVISTERSGVFGFLSDRGVRETIESVVIAIILALLFRTFEAEAFVIPTGSMAPSLQGQHRDINCEQCGYLYQTGASEESSTSSSPMRVQETFCPICAYNTKMDTRKNADHSSNNGDRILVNKFIYDFSEPKRFDVIVFKNPNNGKQNYIKRLIGLPNETLIIENGDIFQVTKNSDGTTSRKIVRKPARKLRAMLQTVDDTNFIPQKLHDVGWPLRWQQWHREGDGGWESTVTTGKPTYVINESSDTAWLHYRNLVPLNRLPAFRPGFEDPINPGAAINEWELYILDGELPDRLKVESPQGRLITDYYCYNHRQLMNKNDLRQSDASMVPDQSLGLHWVGDLGMECWTDVESGTGEIKLQLVEGGAKFTCTIDVESGLAKLTCDSETVSFVDEEGQMVEAPEGTSKIKGAGKYRLMFANVDDQLFLSVNNQFVEFSTGLYQRTGKTRPRSFRGDSKNMGDAEPAAIGAKNVSMDVTRLRILRDVYYTARSNQKQPIGNETDAFIEDFAGIWKRFDSPSSWESEKSIEYFMKRYKEKPYEYELLEDQFLPMGDNSPQSLDGRVWNGPRHVKRDMLIGRALFIYWPHSLNSPVKFFPNFQKMGFIR